MNYAQAAEHELLLRAREDASCVDELLRRYEPMLVKLVQSFDAVSYDIAMQESLGALADAVLHFDPLRGTRFGAYAYVCVRNRLLRCQRKAQAVRPMDDVPEAVSSIPTPEEIALAEEAVRLNQSIAKERLTRLEYAVWRMRIDGYSYAEIAEVLTTPQRKVNVKAVNNALVRVRRKLRGRHE